MNTKPAFRIDVTVRLVPQDTSIPIVEQTASIDSFEQSLPEVFHARTFMLSKAANRAAELLRRALDEAYGEEPL